VWGSRAVTEPSRASRSGSQYDRAEPGSARSCTEPRRAGLGSTRFQPYLRVLSLWWGQRSNPMLVCRWHTDFWDKSRWDKWCKIILIPKFWHESFGGKLMWPLILNLLRVRMGLPFCSIIMWRRCWTAKAMIASLLQHPMILIWYFEIIKD
jgi:hypothetical protein